MGKAVYYCLLKFLIYLNILTALRSSVIDILKIVVFQTIYRLLFSSRIYTQLGKITNTKYLS